MKKILVFAIALIAVTSSCIDEDTVTNNDTLENDPITLKINAFPKEPLTADEILSLNWMREEEKLAHDVYLTLYDKWNINIFSNIASSEEKHTNSVLALLNKYNLPDPVGSNGRGVFSVNSLQTIYNELVTQGSVSILDGYKVGATIEDLDIMDLNNWIEKVDNEDLIYVYENLNKGSRNHMRSFYSQILNSGGTYTAQYISQFEFDVIINGAKENGSW
jgi:hypothetical protein